VSTKDQTELVVDTMLRPTSAGAAPSRIEPSVDARAELSRILTSSVATGALSEQNRAYLTQRITRFTGLSQQDAETRLNDAVGAVRRAADSARRAAVLTGLVTALSLVLSLGAAWWAAIKGGQHRDNAVPPHFDFGQRWRHPSSST
jgi:hypothetical protein